ncbi:MAG: hypothetical protein MNPFHGCM_02977 [Gemmatimonadaceae bacterium]|nr:hypothetical protein [Gemmatimonadaceae bacterium]
MRAGAVRSGMAAVGLFVGMACAQESPRQSTPPLAGFDLHGAGAMRVFLPADLREVSGLAVTLEGRVLAHADEVGVVTQIDPGTGTAIKHFALGQQPPRGDFEGIAVAGERIFLVTSDGRLFETREGADGSSMPFTVTDTGFGKLCEIEGLAWEPTEGVLLLGCKQPRVRETPRLLTLFRWSVEHGRAASPDRLTVDLTGLMSTTAASSVRVSSVDLDPRTGHLFAIAGPRWQVVELTIEGRAVGATALDRRLHPQPEGLVFLGDSVLLIADEGGRDRGMLTRYRRQAGLTGQAYRATAKYGSRQAVTHSTRALSPRARRFRRPSNRFVRTSGTVRTRSPRPGSVRSRPASPPPERRRPARER